ncbi:hypothetical protein F9K79_09430 [Ochrobactrum sp. Kaboul]|nr:hypothetical protein F9K79_09430 [Ochrobactrum sp. Kaboul]
MRPCKAHGCGFFAKGFSTYCEYHKRNLTRHGHPLQKGVTKADLKPYVKEVRTFLADNHPDKAKAVLEDIWGRTVKEAERFLEMASRGRPVIGYELEANQAVLSLSREQGAETIAVTLIAMGVWYEEDPRFWKYDEGFRFQAVRMLLRLNPREASFQWRNGKMERSSYRQIPPRVMQYLWNIIHSTGLIAYGTGIVKHKAKAKAALLETQRQERAVFFGVTSQEKENNR